MYFSWHLPPPGKIGGELFPIFWGEEADVHRLENSRQARGFYQKSMETETEPPNFFSQEKIVVA